MSDETCWTLVEDAARGIPRARDDFARIYLPVVESYLGARWAGSSLRGAVDDAVQDVFVDFVKPNGALNRARREHGTGGFRGFLYGVARNVARRYEEKQRRHGQRQTQWPSSVPFLADDTKPSQAFDRAWARSVMRAAQVRHAERAARGDESALERVELLRLRFQESLPIREIAARWKRDPADVHRQYRLARRDFAEALYETVALQSPGTPAEIKRECARLLGLLA